MYMTEQLVLDGTDLIDDSRCVYVYTVNAGQVLVHCLCPLATKCFTGEDLNEIVDPHCHINRAPQSTCPVNCLDLSVAWALLCNALHSS